VRASRFVGGGGNGGGEFAGRRGCQLVVAVDRDEAADSAVVVLHPDDRDAAVGRVPVNGRDHRSVS